MTRRRVTPVVVGILAVGCSLNACAATPGVSAQGKRAGAAGVERATTSPSSPAASAATTSTTTIAVAPPGSTPGSANSSARPGPAASSSTTTTPSTTSAVGPPPDVVGLSLSAAEQSLQAAGYGAAAHPWGGTCATPDQIMQQVPPADNEVQLFYCAQAS